jgi:hypothetical protein
MNYFIYIYLSLIIHPVRGEGGVAGRCHSRVRGCSGTGAGALFWGETKAVRAR